MWSRNYKLLYKYFYKTINNNTCTCHCICGIIKYRLRHPRQNSINISKEDALKMGWQAVKRAAKNRYLYIFAPSKSERKHLVRSCRYDVQNFVWCEECGTKSPKGSFKKVCSKCSEKIKKEKVLAS